ncbi:hypothetical protein [Lentzea sp. NPDC004782]
MIPPSDSTSNSEATSWSLVWWVLQLLPSSMQLVGSRPVGSL